jgi:hypothetical protein
MKTALISLAVVAILATPGPVCGAGKVKSMSLPDFTKGDKIPEDAKHDWNLGATGARGWIYCDKMVTSDARQIAITKVDKGSPADGVLTVSDVILGVGGKPFSYDPRTEFGKALTLAESEVGKGNLTLTRWRAGSSAEVVVKLPVLGTYSATAPFNCPKSKRILELGCTALAARMADPSYAKLLRFYIGKGCIPYGDHVPWMQTHEDNGKCGMVAVMFNLLGEAKGAEFFSRMSVAAYGAERDCGHTGNFFNILWSMPGVAQSGPQATGAWMGEFGTWYFDLARGWEGNFVHLGPPQMNNDSYAGWDASGGYLLACAMPLKKILLTGKQPNLAPQLDAAAAKALILDGRGWTNKDRNSAYDKLSPDQLLECLGSWSPIVRDRAAMALGRRKGDPPVAALVKMLSATRLETRYGACDGLAALKTAAAPAVPELTKLLQHNDLWMRIKAAETLSGIGAPAMSTVPILLERLAQKTSAEDPRGMEQRYLCFNVFGKMLKNSLGGVDQTLLRKAVIAGLQNQDGRARGAIGGIYQQLSYEQIKPLLPAVRQAIVEPAPSGEMFAAGIRLAGIGILAKHHIKEGMELCFVVMEIDKWGKGNRVPQCLKTLATYGAAAKPMLPRLHQLEKDLLAHPEAKGLQPLIDQLRALIKDLENATGTVELRSLN